MKSRLVLNNIKRRVRPVPPGKGRRVCDCCQGGRIGGRIYYRLEDAVQTAVKEACKTIRNITGVHVKNMTGTVDPTVILLSTKPTWN